LTVIVALSDSLTTGLFTLAGVLVGGAITIGPHSSRSMSTNDPKLGRRAA
jgi:hypothetical protein